MNHYWKSIEPYNIPGSNFTVYGFSRAAHHTAFYIPELDIMLDCGVPHGLFPQHVFITHGHIDHVFQLPICNIAIAKSKTTIQKKPSYYVPEKISNQVNDFIYSTYALSKFNPNHKMNSKYDLVLMTSNIHKIVDIKKSSWKIRVFECDHNVPCLGYGFSEMRKKLKPELLNTPGKELAEMKRNGLEINEIKEVPFFCYLGDSSINVFFNLDNADIFTYPVIFTECTYLYDDEIDMALKNKHIHWIQLESIVKNHPNNIFILYHFSLRYTTQDIHNFFKNIPYKNTVIWVEKIDN